MDVTLIGTRGPAKTETYACTAQQAKAYLAGLVVDMLEQEHGYLLPFETVLKLRKSVGDPKLQESYEKDIADKVSKDYPGCATQFGPLSDWRDYPPVPDVARILRRRFGLLFSSLGLPGWDEGGPS